MGYFFEGLFALISGLIIWFVQSPGVRRERRRYPRHSNPTKTYLIDFTSIRYWGKLVGGPSLYQLETMSL